MFQNLSLFSFSILFDYDIKLFNTCSNISNLQLHFFADWISKFLNVSQQCVRWIKLLQIFCVSFQVFELLFVESFCFFWFFLFFNFLFCSISFVRCVRIDSVIRIKQEHSRETIFACIRTWTSRNLASILSFLFFFFSCESRSLNDKLSRIIKQLCSCFDVISSSSFVHSFFDSLLWIICVSRISSFSNTNDFIFKCENKFLFCKQWLHCLKNIFTTSVFVFSEIVVLCFWCFQLLLNFYKSFHFSCWLFNLKFGYVFLNRRTVSLRFSMSSPNRLI